MNIKVHSNRNLKGKVNISGSKNAAMPIICASILSKDKVTLRNVPRISDIFNLCKILEYVDCKVKFKNNILIIDSSNIHYKPLLIEECRKLRASYYFIGVFLSLFNKCEILLPGGCNIGERPIDYHLDAFKQMGYEYVIENDALSIIKNKNINYIDVFVKNKSVGASINTLLASTHFNEGIISNLLIEPECENLISFLKVLGYNYQTFNDKVIISKKVLKNKKINFKVIPDRIETMTFTVLGLLCGDLIIQKCNPNHLLTPLNILLRTGYKIKVQKDCLHVYKSVGNQIKIKTEVYPGFPTDLQPIFGVLGSQTIDKSYIEETIFENRLQIYKDLIESGIKCNIVDNNVVISPGKVHSKDYNIYDLRHGAALIILAAIGDGDSYLCDFDYVLRGYEDIIKKLNKIGLIIEK